MKKLAILIAGLGIAAAGIPTAANAAPWQSVNARQAQIEARINQGVRSGALTRAEVQRLRTEFRGIARLEVQYRRSAPGLTAAERRDLDRRLDRLSAKVRVEKHDRQHRR